MCKENKTINYINFTKAVAGPPDQNKLKAAKEMLMNLQ